MFPIWWSGWGKANVGRLINQRGPYSRTSAAKRRGRRPIECVRHCCRNPRSTSRATFSYWAEARTRREPWLGPEWSHRRQTMARSLWICPRRPAQQQGRDKKTTKKDKRTDRRRGDGGTGRGRQQALQPIYPAVIQMGIPFALASRTEGGGFFCFCQGEEGRGKRGNGGTETDQNRLLPRKRDWSGKTGTDLDGRHLLGYAGCCCFFFFLFFFLSVFSWLRGKPGERWWKIETREGEVVLLRTALNGRPRAGVNWGENGVENLERERFRHQTALNGRPSAREVVESAWMGAFDTWEHSKRP